MPSRGVRRSAVCFGKIVLGTQNESEECQIGGCGSTQEAVGATRVRDDEGQR